MDGGFLHGLQVSRGRPLDLVHHIWRHDAHKPAANLIEISLLHCGLPVLLVYGGVDRCIPGRGHERQGELGIHSAEVGTSGSDWVLGLDPD
jgi:hypothetical protein